MSSTEDGGYNEEFHSSTGRSTRSRHQKATLPLKRRSQRHLRPSKTEETTQLEDSSDTQASCGRRENALESHLDKANNADDVAPSKTSAAAPETSCSSSTPTCSKDKEKLDCNKSNDSTKPDVKAGIAVTVGGETDKSKDLPHLSLNCCTTPDQKCKLSSLAERNDEIYILSKKHSKGSSVSRSCAAQVDVANICLSTRRPRSINMTPDVTARSSCDDINDGDTKSALELRKRGANHSPEGSSRKVLRLDDENLGIQRKKDPIDCAASIPQLSTEKDPSSLGFSSAVVASGGIAKPALESSNQAVKIASTASTSLSLTSLSEKSGPRNLISPLKVSVAYHGGNLNADNGIVDSSLSAVEPGLCTATVSSVYENIINNNHISNKDISLNMEVEVTKSPTAVTGNPIVTVSKEDTLSTTDQKCLSAEEALLSFGSSQNPPDFLALCNLSPPYSRGLYSNFPGHLPNVNSGNMACFGPAVVPVSGTEALQQFVADDVRSRLASVSSHASDRIPASPSISITPPELSLPSCLSREVNESDRCQGISAHRKLNANDKLVKNSLINSSCVEKTQELPCLTSPAVGGDSQKLCSSSSESIERESLPCGAPKPNGLENSSSCIASKIAVVHPSLQAFGVGSSKTPQFFTPSHMTVPSATVAVTHSCSPVSPALAAPQPPLLNLLSSQPFLSVLPSQVFDSTKPSISSPFYANISTSSTTQTAVVCSSADMVSQHSPQLSTTSSPTSLPFVAQAGTPSKSTMNLNPSSDPIASRAHACPVPFSTDKSAFSLDVMQSRRNTASCALSKRNESKFFHPPLDLPLGPSLKKLRDQQALESMARFSQDDSRSNSSVESHRRLNNLASLISPASGGRTAAPEVSPREPTTRISVALINSHFICSLCSGYFVDATTIVVCFHSFCRACIVRYLEHSVFCPVCEVLLHSVAPTSKLRPDPQLQGLLYAILPELYYDELLRRRAFYLARGAHKAASLRDVWTPPDPQDPGQAPHSASPLTSPSRACSTPPGARPELLEVAEEDPQKLRRDFELSAGAGRLVCSGDLLCVQLLNCHLPHTQKPRYLQCPAMAPAGLLKRLLRAKFSLSPDEAVLLLVPDVVHLQRRSRSPAAAAHGDAKGGEAVVAHVPDLKTEDQNRVGSSSSSGNGTAVNAGADGGFPSPAAAATTTAVRNGTTDTLSATVKSGTMETSFPATTKSGATDSLPKPGAHPAAFRFLEAREDPGDVPSGGNGAVKPVSDIAQAAGEGHRSPSEAGEGDEEVGQSSAAYPGVLLLDRETLRDAAYLQNWRKERPIKIFYKIFRHSKRERGSLSQKVGDKKEFLSIPCDLINNTPTADSIGPSSCSVVSTDSQPPVPALAAAPSAVSESGDFSAAGARASELGGRPDVQAEVSARAVPASGVAILPKPEVEKPAQPEDCLQKWRNVQAQQLQKLEKVATSGSSKPKAGVCPSSSHNKTELKPKISSSNKPTKLSSQKVRGRNLGGGLKEGKKSGDVMGTAPSITSIARGTSGSIYSQSLNGVTMRAAPTNAALGGASGDGGAGLVISALSHQQLLLLQDQQQLAQFQQLSQVQHLYSFQRLQQQPLSQGFALDDGSSNSLSQKSLLGSSILPAINSDAKPSNALLPSSDVSNLFTAGMGTSHLNFSGLATDPSGLFFAAGGVSSNMLNTLSGNSIASPMLNMNAFAPFNLGYGIMPLVSTPNVLSNGSGLTLLNSSGSLQAIVSGSGQSVDASNSLAPPTLLTTDGSGFMNIGASAVTPDLSGLALQGATILPFGVPFGQSTGSLFCLGTNTNVAAQNNDAISPLTIVPVSSEADDISDCSTNVSSVAESLPLTASAMTLEDCLNIAGVTSVVDPPCSNSEAESIVSTTSSFVASSFASTSSSDSVSHSDTCGLPFNAQPGTQYSEKPGTMEPVSSEAKSSSNVKMCGLSPAAGASVSCTVAGEVGQGTFTLSESEWKEVQLKISETGVMSVSAGDDHNSVMESLLDQVESESSQLLLSSIESTCCSATSPAEVTRKCGNDVPTVPATELPPTTSIASSVSTTSITNSDSSCSASSAISTTSTALVTNTLSFTPLSVSATSTISTAKSVSIASTASITSTSSSNDLPLVGKTRWSKAVPSTTCGSSVAQACSSGTSASSVPSPVSACIEVHNSVMKFTGSERGAECAILSARNEHTHNSTCKSVSSDRSSNLSSVSCSTSKCSSIAKSTNINENSKIDIKSANSCKGKVVVGKSASIDATLTSSTTSDITKNSVKSSCISSSTSAKVGTVQADSRHPVTEVTPSLGGVVSSVASGTPVSSCQASETTPSKKSGNDENLNLKDSVQPALPSSSSSKSSFSAAAIQDPKVCSLKEDSSKQTEVLSGDVQSDDELPPLKVCESVKRHSSEDWSESSKKLKLEVAAPLLAASTPSPLSSPSPNKEDRPILNRKMSKLKEIAEKQRSLTAKSNDCSKEDRLTEKAAAGSFDSKSRHIPLDVAAATLSASLKNLSKLTAKSQLPSTVGTGSSKKQEGKGENEKLGRKSHSVGYKTLNTSPKGWNPTISKEQFQLGVSNVGLPKTNKFFKARNAPRLLSSSSLSVLKASVSSPIVDTTNTASNSKVKKKLSPVSKPDLDKGVKPETRNTDDSKRKDAVPPPPSLKTPSTSSSAEATCETSKNINTSPKLSPSSVDSRASSKLWDAKQKLDVPEGPSVQPKTPVTSPKLVTKTSPPKTSVASHPEESDAVETKPTCSFESSEKVESGPSVSTALSTSPTDLTLQSEIGSVSTSPDNEVVPNPGVSPSQSQTIPVTTTSDSAVKNIVSNTHAFSRDKNACPPETSKSSEDSKPESNVRCLRSFHKKLEAAKHADPGLSVRNVSSESSSKSETSTADSNVSEMPSAVENAKAKPQTQISSSSEQPLTSVSLGYSEAGSSVTAEVTLEPLKSAFESTLSKKPDALVASASKDVSVNSDRAVSATVKDIIPCIDSIASALAIKNSAVCIGNDDTSSVSSTASCSTARNSGSVSNVSDSAIASSATGPLVSLFIDSVTPESPVSCANSRGASTVSSNALVTPIISSSVTTLKKTQHSVGSPTACDGSSSAENVKSVSRDLKQSTKSVTNVTKSLANSPSVSSPAISSVEGSNTSTDSTASAEVPSIRCKANSSHDTVVVTSSVDCSVNSFISSKEVGTTVKSTSCIISSISCVLSVNDESSSGRCQTNSSSKGPSIAREERMPFAKESAKGGVVTDKAELKAVDKSVLDNNEKPCSVASSGNSSVATQSTHLMVPSVPLVPVSNRSFSNQNVSATTIKAKKSNKNQDVLNSDQALVGKMKSSVSATTHTVAQPAEESTECSTAKSSANEPCRFLSNKVTSETAGRKLSSTTAASSNPNTVATQASNTSSTAPDTTQSLDNPFSHFNPNYYMPYSLYHGSIASHANSSYPYLSSSLNYYNQGVPANSSCDTNTASSGGQSCRNPDSRPTALTWNDANYGNLYNPKISQSSSPTSSQASQGHTYTHCSSRAQSSGVSHTQNASIIANVSSMSAQNSLEFKNSKNTVSSSLTNCAHENLSQATHFSACSLKSSAVSSALSSPPKASLPHVYSPNVPSTHSLSQSSSSCHTSLSNISPRNRANTSYTDSSVTQMSSHHRSAKADKMLHFESKAGSPCSLDLTDASSSACTKESAKKAAKVNQAVASAKKIPTTSNKNTPCSTPSLDSHNQMLQNYPMLNSPSYALSNFMSQNAFQQATPNFFDPFSAYGFSRGISSTGQSGSVGLGNNYSDFHNTANRTSDMSSYDYSGGSATPKTCSDTRSTSQYYPYNTAGYFNSSSSSSPSTHHDSSNTMNALNAYLSNINNSHSYPGYAMAANFHYLMPNSFPMNMMQSSWNSFQLAKGSGSMPNSLDSSQYGNSSANSYSGFYYNQNMGYPSSSFMGNAGSYNNYPYLPMPPFGHFSASQTSTKTTQVPQSPGLHSTQASSPASNKTNQKTTTSTNSKTFPSMPSPHFDSRLNSVSKAKRQSNSTPIDATSSNSLASCESLLSACASSSLAAAAAVKSRTSSACASPASVPSQQPKGHAASLKESTVQAVTEVLSSLAQLAPASFDPKTLSSGSNNSKFLSLPASCAHSKTSNQSYLSVSQAKKDTSNTSKRVPKLNSTSKGGEDKAKDSCNSDSSSRSFSGHKDVSEKQSISSDPTNLSVASKLDQKCSSHSLTNASMSTCDSSQSAANSSKSSDKADKVTDSNSALSSNENLNPIVPTSHAPISHGTRVDWPSDSKNPVVKQSSSTSKSVKPPLKLVRPAFSSSSSSSSPASTSCASSSSVDTQSLSGPSCQTGAPSGLHSNSPVKSSASSVSHATDSSLPNCFAVGASDTPPCSGGVNNSS